MAFFNTLKSFFSPGNLQAAATLPPPTPPKVKPKQASYPSYMTSTRVSDSALPKSDRRLASTDLNTYRNGRNTQEVLRNLAYSSPDLSNAVFSYLRVAITDKYTAIARNMDGTVSPEGTAYVQQLITRFDNLGDYSLGFAGLNSMRSNSEALGKELMLYGACSAELVFGKGLIPSKIQPISVPTIVFYPDKEGVQPYQIIGGEEISLDTPAFAYVSLDQNLLDPYPSSPLEPAIKAVLFSEDFIADLQRVMKRAVHPRPVITIDEEKFRKYMPVEAQHDPEVATNYMNGLISSLESKINGLKPEDALIFFDSIGIELASNGNSSISAEWETIEGMAFSRLASGAKVMPSILGKDSTSNVASTSSMLFLKNAEGAVQTKLNEIYSRLFTLAVRVGGFDCYVEFRYAKPDLRPDSEIAAFRQTEQMMTLELLSLGLITDEEASIKLTGHLPPAGAEKLSGTGFRTNAAPASSVESTALYGGATNDGSALNQNLKPDAPDTARGQNKK
jgi:hypothetical protein